MCIFNSCLPSTCVMVLKEVGERILDLLDLELHAVVPPCSCYDLLIIAFKHHIDKGWWPQLTL